MQEIATRSTHNSRLELPDSFSSCSELDSTNDSINYENENILLKARLLCRMGIGPQAFLSMGANTRSRINSYAQKKAASEQEEEVSSISCNLTPKKGNTSYIEDSEVLNLDVPDVASSRESSDTCAINLQDRARMDTVRWEVLNQAKIVSRNVSEINISSAAPVCSPRTNSNNKPPVFSRMNSQTSRANCCEEGDYEMNFVKRTDEEARSLYYDRLIKMNILRLTPSKKAQSIVIFDWDDTILCTSYLLGMGIKKMTPSVMCSMKPVDEMASKLLKKASDSGKVFIVTNAEEGWVQHSAEVFLPKTYEIITGQSIEIISARTCYEQKFPNDNCQWKKEAFANLSKNFDKNIITNIICIGDSNIEMDAAHLLARKFEKAIIKTVKFRELPKQEDLSKQQCLVFDKFDQIFVSHKDMTIRLERRRE